MSFPKKQNRPRKFSKGAVITTPAEFADVVISRGWVFLNNSDRATHSAFAANAPIMPLYREISKGQVRRAVRSPHFPYVFRVCYLASTHTAKVNRLYQATCDDLPKSYDREAKSLIKVMEAVRAACDFADSESIEFTLRIYRDHPPIKSLARHHTSVFLNMCLSQVPKLEPVMFRFFHMYLVLGTPTRSAKMETLPQKPEGPSAQYILKTIN